LRVPTYLKRLVGYAPRGVWVVGRVLWAAVSAARDRRSFDAMIDATTASGGGIGVLYRARRDYYRRLLYVTVFVFVVAVVVVSQVWALWSGVGWGARLGLVSGLLLLLGWVGHLNQPVPILDPVYTMGVPPALTRDLIIDALDSLGIAKLAAAIKEDPVHAVRQYSPVTRSGAGWEVDLELPSGVTVEDVVKRRGQLASGLKRPLGQVWPGQVAAQHPGRLLLYVADESMADRKLGSWPFTHSGVTNVFEPIQIGVAADGTPVSPVLMFVGGVIGAVPRMGKTAALRLLTLSAALDPRCRIFIADLKGGGDFLALEPVADELIIGDEEDDIARALKMLRAMRAEMRKRYKAFREMDRNLAPDAKITSELADRIPPVFLAVDECQMWFDHLEHGKELMELATDLVKRGPAVGIMTWWATQRPDKDSLPSGIRDNIGLRLAMRVTAQIPNDMILGTGAYKAGIKATAFTRQDLGIGYLVGEAEEAIITQMFYVDNVDATRIVARAVAARADQDDLFDVDDAGVMTLAERVLAVWPEARTRVWTVTLVDLLAGRWPAEFADWTPTRLGTALNIKATQIKKNGKNRQGYLLADIQAAVAKTGGRDAA